MKYHNIRYGFATNSSSSHSIVILKGKVPHTERETYIGDFGWEQFILADIESKTDYLLTLLSDAPRDLLKKVFGRVPEEEWYVDHQSRFSFPKKLSESEEFLELLKEEIENPQLVIYGGNDNGGIMDIPEATFPNLLREYPGILNYRKDGPYFTFLYQDGTKVRVSKNKVEDYLKASTPELVDLKITDYCPFGCSFCYQGSTTEGVHAPLERIKQILLDLKELNVLEIAFGGGEPTLHPDFKEIINFTKSLGISANISTKNFSIVKDIYSSVPVDGIGVSISSLKEYEKVRQIIYHCENIYFHLPIGTCDLAETIEIMELASNDMSNILLLGSKSQHRGKILNPPTDEALAVALKLMVDETKDISISIDTAFLDQYPKTLNLLNVYRVFLSSPEGKFSMYIDAVEEKMGPSSYGNEYVPLGDAKKIKEEFSKW